MKIALFGGTFDPVHRGHLAVARAAADKFGLSQVLFAPADIPPHKQKRPLTDFHHRFAMLAIAAAGDDRFVPSLIDAPTGKPNYSIDTVRRLKQKLKRSGQLYFLIGMDAFQEISTWREPVKLLNECEFIVAARPGHSLADAARALPASLRPQEMVLRALSRSTRESIAVRGAKVHLLNEVDDPVSSTEIRAVAARSSALLSELVPAGVAEYIRKEHLYVAATAVAKLGKARTSSMLSLHRKLLRSHRG